MGALGIQSVDGDWETTWVCMIGMSGLFLPTHLPTLQLSMRSIFLHKGYRTADISKIHEAILTGKHYLKAV